MFIPFITAKNPRFLVALAAAPVFGLAFVSMTMGASTRRPSQPIAFFHRVHAGERNIPCAYCHRTAETASFAGMPPTRLCMSCHRAVIPEAPEIWKLRSYWELGEPIPWERVSILPGHVYFSHRAHAGAAKVGCSRCHGKVEAMDEVEQTVPLTMGWCVQCHRETRASTECISCHR